VADTVSPAVRSRMMSGIRSSSTGPERLMGSWLHASGFRYRRNVATLPGKPDLVFPRYRAVILVNGCFWHGHRCHLFRWPATHAEFWKEKIGRNRRRDRRVQSELVDAGWRVLVVWECGLRAVTEVGAERLSRRISAWLRKGPRRLEIPRQPRRHSA